MGAGATGHRFTLQPSEMQQIWAEKGLKKKDPAIKFQSENRAQSEAWQCSRSACRPF